MPWESRQHPSPGGLHCIRILCLPLADRHAVHQGVYDPTDHSIRKLPGDEALAKSMNARSIGELVGSSAGSTLQLVADETKLAACYEGHRSLLWREAGALSAVICLVATALRLTSVVVGRHGGDIVEASGFSSQFVAVGAVHVGSIQDPTPVGQ